MKNFILTIALAVSTVALAQQVPSNVPTTGLLAWYGLNGNVADSSGNGNHMTNYSAVSTTDRNGNANSAYSFSGNSQYLAEASPSWTMTATGSMTVSIWVKSTTGGIFFWNGLTQGQGGTGKFCYFLVNTGSGNTEFWANKQGLAWLKCSTSNTANTWTHWVATYSNSTMKWYKNGVLVSTTSYTYTNVNSASMPLYIGKGGGTNYFTGSVDDIGIWNRALTQAEITGLYNMDCTGFAGDDPDSVSTSVMANVEFISGGGSTYQWQQNTGSGFVNCTNSSQLAGATNDTLSLSSVNLSNNNTLYRCLVTMANCEDTTATALLSVSCDNLISVEPQNDTLTLTNNAVFSVNSVFNSGVSYQWQRNTSGTWSNLSDGTQYTGTTGKYLAVYNVGAAEHMAEFRCLVSGNNCTDTSAIAIIVTDLSTVEGESIAPSIHPMPVSRVATVMHPTSWEGSWYTITNLTGQVVFKGMLSGDSSTTIDISTLPRGVYLLNIKNRGSYKIVKQ